MYKEFKHEFLKAGSKRFDLVKQENVSAFLMKETAKMAYYECAYTVLTLA